MHCWSGILSTVTFITWDDLNLAMQFGVTAFKILLPPYTQYMYTELYT